MDDTSSIATTYQVAGIGLLAIVLAQLGRTFSSRPSRWWAAAWTALAIALIAAGLSIGAGSLLLEWAFLLLLWLGCREIAQRKTRVVHFLYIGALVALALAALIARWASMFTIEAVMIALGALASLYELTRSQGATAMPMMRIALLAFAVLYAVGAPVLLGSVFLGCSMIVLIAEGAHHRLEQTLAGLENARSRLEQRLHTDALTEALSRHAFYWMQQGSEIATSGALSGVVVMFDIDNLKQINDVFGHHAGDVAIRSVANAIRTVIRGDDLLFRWGGDEFVAVIPNLSGPAVAERLATFVNPITTQLEDGWPMQCRITWGHAEFGGQQSIDDAIRLADQRMYAARGRS